MVEQLGYPASVPGTPDHAGTVLDEPLAGVFLHNLRTYKNRNIAELQPMVLDKRLLFRWLDDPCADPVNPDLSQQAQAILAPVHHDRHCSVYPGPDQNCQPGSIYVYP